MKGDKCLLTSFDLICHIGQTPKKEIDFKKKHTVRAGQDFPPLAVFILEYQRNTGSQNLVWSTKFKADIVLVLRKLSGTDFLPCEVG